MPIWSFRSPRPSQQSAAQLPPAAQIAAPTLPAVTESSRPTRIIVKEGPLRPVKQSIVPFDPASLVGLRSGMYWAVLSSSDRGNGMLLLSLYMSQAEAGADFPTIDEYRVLADLVSKTDKGFTISRPGLLGKPSVTAFESEDDGEAWFAAVSVTTAKAATVASTAVIGRPFGNPPRLPGRPVARLLHGALQLGIGKVKTVQSPAEQALRRHRDFLSMMVSFDRVVFEAFLVADVRLTKTVEGYVYGRPAVVEHMATQLRAWSMASVGEITGDEEKTQSPLRLLQLTFAFEADIVLVLRWRRGQVCAIELRPANDEVRAVLSLLKDAQEELKEYAKELQEEPLPYDVVDEGVHEEGAMLEKFAIDRVLGAGSFGTVKLASNREDGTMRAIKSIPKSLQAREDLETEIKLMRAANEAMGDAPHSIQLFETYEGPDDYYLVMEVVAGGEVYDRIVAQGSFTLKEALGLLRQLMTGMNRLHMAGIMHRDLKPQNLLYATKAPDAPLKIADFGLGCFFSDIFSQHAACGTPMYMAPELILSGETCTFDEYGMPMRIWRTYGPSVDVWSCGCILYELLSGHVPFRPKWVPEGGAHAAAGTWDLDAMYQDIIAGHFSFPETEWSHLPDAAQRLISWMLEVDPSQRPTAAAVLEHPWVQGSLEGAEAGEGVNLSAVVGRLTSSRASYVGIAADAASVASARQRMHELAGAGTSWASFFGSISQPR